MEEESSEFEDTAMVVAIAAQSFTVISLLHNQLLHSSIPSAGQPKHISALSGEAYTQEILSCGHEERIFECFHMSLQTFKLLCQKLRYGFYLKDTRYTSVEQQVHIFLFITTTASSNRTTQERFQHSSETISCIFRKVLTAINAISSQYIRHASAGNTDLSIIPPEIQGNPKLTPFFNNCLGAIDGSLIPIKVSSSQAAVNRTRKGFTAQNVLVVCSFDSTINYVLAGWEGSAHDSRVLADAFMKGFAIPKGKFYLGDAGYGISPECLTPYRGIRYHLREQVVGDVAYVSS